MLLCILSTSLAFAQIATTRLHGIVKDPSGALIPGATITITNSARGTVLSTKSDAAGVYDFPQIAPARYTIKVSATGFGDQTKAAELLVNQPATVDFTLTVQASSVTVDVSGEAQTLNTSDASLGNATDNAEIQALPSETRNVPDLLALQPGVFYLPPQQGGGGDSRNGAVNGGRSDQGNVTMDGIDDNDQVNGFAFTGVLRETQDSVEEFRVATGGDNADQGRSSGAQVSMVTKSGTNKFHGAAYEYYRWPRVAANDWFVKQGQFNSGSPNTPPKILRNIFGADLGGPIKKDKLFFFGNYEGERQAEDQAVARTVPTPAYQSGELVYPDANGVKTILSQSQVAQLDAGCKVCNTAAYPNPPGPNPNALGYFQSMPSSNGDTLGDGGFDSGSFSFASPAPIHLNTSIARIDYIPNDSHRIFVRGNLQDDTIASVVQFPGQPASSINADNSKGVVGGDTWTINPRMVNDLRYGYIRQGFGISGQGKGDYVDFRFLNSPTAETRNRIVSVPVNNLVDNFSWVKGNHNLMFGVNWRLVQQNNATDANSFNGASTNPYWLGGNPPDPSGIGAPSVNGNFDNSYVIAYGNLIGAVPSLTQVSNYKLTSASSGTALPDGAFVYRHFKANEYEGFVQDAWRIRPNVTITVGLRYTYLQTPWETSGQQVTPTIDTDTWYKKRETEAQAGQIYEADLQFAPAGPHYGKPGFWQPQKGNIAPRVAIAWAPNARTSVRAGAGIYYDHFGEALVNNFDQNGSFGMSSSVTNPAGIYQAEGQCADPSQCSHPGSPRFIARNQLPPIGGGSTAATVTFPYTAPLDNFAITWGLNSKIQTPYSETLDFSIQRELGGGFTLETAYVGRLGRHLLNQLDLADAVDYVDPGGGGDYYAAGTQLSKMVDKNNGNYPASVPAIKYFEDVFPFMAGYDYPGESATQAIYNNEWAPYRSNLGATSALADLDFYDWVYGFYPVPANWRPHFWQDQFGSLFSLSSMGMSYYNAGQFSLHHPASHGLTFDMNVTWAHSIDWGSDTERSTEFGGNSSNTGAFSEITNTWKPYLSKGDSDFDTRVFVTGDWVYLVPVGRGKMIGGNSNGLLNAIIGGWQWSGINRWSTGLPFSLFEPGWTTNWQIESYGVQTGPIPTKKHYDSTGEPQYFANPNAINSGLSCGGCNGGNERLPYPGEAGQRNNFRGDGVFDIDSGLTKIWKVRGTSSVRFDWEVYNVSNSVRFDPASISSGLTGGSLGIASSELTVPRRMQFALRYDF